MTVHYLRRIALAVLALGIPLIGTNGFVHPAKTFNSLNPLAKRSLNKHKAASIADYDFTLPPGLELKDYYEQGQVPLFNVVNATMRVSKLIYSFSAMKLDIRNNKDKWIDGDVMLKEDTPLLEEEISEFVIKNRDRVAGNDEFKNMLDYEMGLKGDNRIRCMDAKYTQQELCYGINVNRSRRQVTVAFRGTNTAKDLLVDLDFRKFKCTDGTETYGLHNGFRGYLNAETAVDGDGDLTKLEQIHEKLDDIMASDCKGFDVFVTGHSLGGALATLYGLRLAQTRKYPLVTIVSFASPYVGDEGFRKVFRQAELDGIVRHIRVSNSNDCIPANPCIGGFSHVGVNLELRKSGPVMNYEGVDKPSLPLAFVTFLGSASFFVGKFLSLFIGFPRVPTLSLLPAGLVTYAMVKVLLDSHLFPQYRERLRTGLENAGYLSKTIEELYGKRIEIIKKDLNVESD